MSLLLDTHAALWLVQGDPRLGKKALTAVSELQPEDVMISDIVLLELSMLIAKGRLQIQPATTHFLRDFSRLFRVVPIDADIAAAAMALNLPQGDPFDRVIVATAQRHQVSLVTRDKAIRSSRIVPTIW